MLTVMSYNIRYANNHDRAPWELRRNHLIPIIQKANPDLIGFQEVLHCQYVDLITQLPEYGHMGIARDDGRDKGERTPIFYRKERFDLLDYGDFWLSETPNVPSLGWDAACSRICTYACFRDKAAGGEFMHFNTHLDHMGRVAQLEGAKLILRRMQANGIPAFITGDFNVEENSIPYNVFTQNGLADAKYAAEQTMSYGTFNNFSNNPNIREQSPIDYLFFNPEHFNIDSYEVLVSGEEGNWASDHYPILVLLKMV